MRRRSFVAMLGAGWPVRVLAEPLPVIGFLHPGSADSFPYLVAAFRQGLSELGYVEDKNVGVEYRWAEGRYEQLPALAADLVGRKVSVIVNGGGPPLAVARLQHHRHRSRGVRPPRSRLGGSARYVPPARRAEHRGPARRDGRGVFIRTSRSRRGGGALYACQPWGRWCGHFVRAFSPLIQV